MADADFTDSNGGQGVSGSNTAAVPEGRAGSAGPEPDYEPRRLSEALFGCRFSRPLIVDSIGSTNTALYELARCGEPEGLVLVAEEQSAGRGRLDRRWVSPKGKSVLVSFLVRAGIDPQLAGLLNAAAGLAVREAVEAAAGISVGLKWPNDVVWEEKKLGGILTESGADRAGQRFWVVGIGLNVNWERSDFPHDIAETASSLFLASGSRMDRTALLAGVALSLDRLVGKLESDPGSLLEAYKAALTTLGRRVRARLVGEVVEGVAEDIDDKGDLVVATDSGERRGITAGDITELRTP